MAKLIRLSQLQALALAVGAQLFLTAPIAQCESQPDSLTVDFATAQAHFQFQFPRDHGAHERFRTEWWYYTGHLFTESSEPFKDHSRYGFQLTFFRRTDDHGAQFYLAHAALSDHKEGTFLTERRFGAGGTGLAGARVDDLDVWLEEWRAERFGDTYVLSFGLGKISPFPEVRLITDPPAGPVLQGANGYSRKGSCPSCASMYYSYPRLAVRGHIRTSKGIEPVHGLAWMDHEFMSNSLEKDQIGWDWFSILLPDGRNIVLFELRQRNGGRSFAAGSVSTATAQRSLQAADFEVEKTSYWKSEKTGATYPVAWTIKIPSEGVTVPLKARQTNQELPATSTETISYWEGAAASSSPPALAYVEMTGYDRPLDRPL